MAIRSVRSGGISCRTCCCPMQMCAQLVSCSYYNRWMALASFPSFNCTDHVAVGIDGWRECCGFSVMDRFLAAPHYQFSTLFSPSFLLTASPGTTVADPNLWHLRHNHYTGMSERREDTRKSHRVYTQTCSHYSKCQPWLSSLPAAHPAKTFTFTRLNNLVLYLKSQETPIQSD